MKTKPKPIFSTIAGFFRQVQQRTSVALMASFISVCALGVSWYQVKLARHGQNLALQRITFYSPRL
ncbi:MAG: hypothetical protein IPN76_18360 [Saprospiraceae bacterium]|nr:hypothetical protein [Saprospiraceae bacterium]